jgi:hypothetical protein
MYVHSGWSLSLYVYKPSLGIVCVRGEAKTNTQCLSEATLDNSEFRRRVCASRNWYMLRDINSHLRMFSVLSTYKPWLSSLSGWHVSFVTCTTQTFLIHLCRVQAVCVDIGIGVKVGTVRMCISFRLSCLFGGSLKLYKFNYISGLLLCIQGYCHPAVYDSMPLVSIAMTDCVEFDLFKMSAELGALRV